jgi:hypothetical protein
MMKKLLYETSTVLMIEKLLEGEVGTNCHILRKLKIEE